MSVFEIIHLRLGRNGFQGLLDLGRRSPDGPRAALSALANHFFYGLGLAGGVALI